MPLMQPQHFEDPDTENAIDFYIPGPGGVMPDGPVLVAGTGRTFLHVWPDGEVSAFSHGIGFSWLVEPKNRLVQLSEFITGFTPTILRPQHRGNRIIRADGAVLRQRGGHRLDLWVTLTSGLELRAFRTDTTDGEGGEAAGIKVLSPESATTQLRDFVPKHLQLSAIGLLDSHHLLRVAPVPGTQCACYAAVYIAVEALSFVMLLEYTWAPRDAAPSIRHVGTVHAVPDTLTDLSIAEHRLW
jgi:hypothetical protein